jgi:hypothetical protein
MESNKFRTIGYWAATGVVAVGFGFGALADLTASTEVMVSLSRLGYPGYLAAILGLWKALGVAAILAPRFERLKEWAYAGMFFDLTGAAVSHAVAGDPLGKALVPMVILGFVMASWALRPANRRLVSATAPASAQGFSGSAALARS